MFYKGYITKMFSEVQNITQWRNTRKYEMVHIMNDLKTLRNNKFIIEIYTWVERIVNIVKNRINKENTERTKTFTENKRS